MKILMVGDIVGSPGRTVFARVVNALREAGKVDFVVANAENAAGGKGLTSGLAQELLDAGADVITMGDHTWDQKELEGALDSEERILRPANFPPGCPGKGVVSVDSDVGRVTVMNLIGRTFMRAYDCPFRAADSILDKEPNTGKIMLVDFHAEATSEKIAMGRYLDGRVTAVAGTHTHVQTSDECIMPKGTAYITDLGMTGPKNSVIGCEAEPILSSFLTGMRCRFGVARDSDSAVVEGVIITADEKTGKATGIKRIRE